jgi:ABC-type transport system substrate-binding protein
LKKGFRFLLMILLVEVITAAIWFGWRWAAPYAKTQRYANLEQGDNGKKTLRPELRLGWPAPLQAMNPFLPKNEAEHQLCELLYPPLLRYDNQGKLSPALAKSWKWQQQITCWFSSGLRAREVAQEMQQQQKNAGLQLETDGPALTLIFPMTEKQVSQEMRQTLDQAKPLPLTFLRLRFSQPEVEKSLRAFATQAEHSAHTKRLWFDGDGRCEMVTTRRPLPAQEAIQNWLRQKGLPSVEIQPLTEVSALLETLLDFQLQPGAAWPDGKAVRAADVRASWAYVQQQRLPLPGSLVQQHIQDVLEPAPGSVRIIYRARHSSALAAWSALPILPQSWLSKNAQNLASAPIPSSSGWQLAEQSSQHWIYRHQDRSKRFHTLAIEPVVTGQRYDVCWPQMGQAEQDLTALHYQAPATHELLLYWQTQSPLLADVRLRKALQLLLDRKQLMRMTQVRGMQPKTTFLKAGTWFSPRLATSPAVLDEAESLLKEASWLRDIHGRMKKAGQLLEVRLLVPGDNADRRQLADALATSWGQLGIETQVLTPPREEGFHRIQQGEFDAVLLGSVISPGWDLQSLWHSQEISTGRNPARLSDAKLDLLLEALDHEFDPRILPRRASAVQARLDTLCPAVPLFASAAEMRLSSQRFIDLRPDDFLHGMTLFDLFAQLNRSATDTLPPDVIPDLLPVPEEKTSAMK